MSASSWMNGYAHNDREESRSASAYFTGPYPEDQRPTKFEIAREEREDGRRG